MTRTALVTGASGFMGTHMVEVLCQAGYRVRASDLPHAMGQDDPERGRFPGLLKQLGVETVPADVTQPETLEGLSQGVDEVYHIAAIFDYSAPPELLQRVNVEGTRYLLQEIEASGDVKKLILWGAGGIYGRPLPGRVPIREDEHPVAPANHYSRSKWDQEKLVRDWAGRNRLPFVVLRPTGVYGPRSIYGMMGVITSLAHRRRLIVPRNFTFPVPFVHVRDVCEAAAYLAGRRESENQAFNLNDDTEMDFVAFTKFIGEELGIPVVTLPGIPLPVVKVGAYLAAAVSGLWSRYVSGKRPTLEKETLAYLGGDYRYSNAKLKAHGYRFRYPLATEGLRETIAWYRAQGLLPERHSLATPASTPSP